jgi:hypothetical protein
VYTKPLDLWVVVESLGLRIEEGILVGILAVAVAFSLLFTVSIEIG